MTTLNNTSSEPILQHSTTPSFVTLNSLIIKPNRVIYNIEGSRCKVHMNTHNNNSMNTDNTNSMDTDNNNSMDTHNNDEGCSWLCDLYDCNEAIVYDTNNYWTVPNFMIWCTGKKKQTQCNILDISHKQWISTTPYNFITVNGNKIFKIGTKRGKDSKYITWRLLLYFNDLIMNTAHNKSIGCTYYIHFNIYIYIHIHIHLYIYIIIKVDGLIHIKQI